MSASFLEVVQTLAAFLAASMTLVAKFDADKSMLAVKLSGYNGTRLLIGSKNCRVENVLLAVQVGLFLAGLWTLFLAPPPFEAYTLGDEVRTSLAREIRLNITVTRLAMTWASVWLMFLSYRNWIELMPLRAQRRTDAAAKSVVESAQIASGMVAQLESAAVKAQTVADTAQEVATDVRQVVEIVPAVMPDAKDHV